MSQGIKEIKFCSEGHSNKDFVYSDRQNYVHESGRCGLCTKEHFIQEFKTWSSGNTNIDRIIQESQINNIYD
ncbi:7848_t:CDS:1, partial [Diversispora eburnea]